MGPHHLQDLLLLFLLGASLTLAQHLYCHKGTSMGIEEHPSGTFNWTTEKTETCDNGALCQESVLVIKSGTKTAILATKGCVTEGAAAITFAQHSPPPGIVTVSYSNYCEDALCNNRKDLLDLWNPEVILGSLRAPSVPATLHCPTCVAFGTCLHAPSLPCPKGTTRCYQGRLQITGGDVDSSLEVKGCTSIAGCRLMSGVFMIGPIWVKEVCPHQSLIQPRKTGNGATWLPISLGRLGLLVLLSLPSLVLCS